MQHSDTIHNTDHETNHITLYYYLERIGHLLRADEREVSASYGLQPIQLQMLHYLNTCNRYSDTPAGVTEYFQLTKGTVSQSLKALEQKKLLEKEPDAQDKRVVHLKLTSAAKTLLADAIPPPALKQLDHELLAPEIIASLQELLGTLQRQNNLRGFGVCRTCRYHLVEGKNQFRCGLTQEVLFAAERDLICREYEENN